MLIEGLGYYQYCTLKTFPQTVIHAQSQLPLPLQPTCRGAQSVVLEVLHIKTAQVAVEGA